MIDNLNLKARIVSDNLILEKRNHNHDIYLWQAINQNRLFLNQYLTWVDTTQSINDVAQATDKFLFQWDNQEKFAYCILESSSPEVFGMIDVQKIDYQNHTVEIGYWLQHRKTGKGYVSNALKLLEKELARQSVKAIRINCDQYNKNSSSVAQRNHYVLEKTLPNAIDYHGQLHNKEIYVKFFD